MTAVLGLAILLAAAPSSAGPQPSAEADSRRTEPTAAQAVAASIGRADRSAAATVDGVRRLAEPGGKGRTAEPQHEPHTVLVRFKAGTSASARGRVAGRVGGKVSTDTSTTGYVKITTSGPAAKAVAALRDDAAVAEVSLDYRRTKSKVPNDYYYAQYQKYLATIRLPQAWDVQSAATGVTIAIVDTGVDGGHPDLAGKLVAGYNSVADNNQTADYDGHGTMVAGIAAANTGNTYGVAGAAYNGRIMPIMVFSGEYAYDSDIAEGVIWAVDHGAKIVNMSLGGAGQTPVLHEAVKYAVGKGVLVVVAAGNTGDDSPHYPAMYPEVLTVGATDHAAALTDFSSWGDHVDLAAPGFDIISTHSRTTEYGPSFAYGIGAGTSYSSPLVAGVAALVRAKYPSLTPAQVIERLKSTARDAGPRGIDPYYGYGVVDAYRALGGAATTDFAMKPAGANEPDDVPARATAVPLSAEEFQSITGSSAIEGDVDWYRFEVKGRESRVALTLTPPAHDGRRAQNFDPVLALYDAELRLIQEVDSTQGVNAVEQLSQPLYPGTYYVKVRNFNGAPDERAYTLRKSVGNAGYWDFPAFGEGAYGDVAVSGETTAIGDVTGDGRPDALLTSGHDSQGTGRKLFVFAQAADGTMAAARQYETRIQYDEKAAIAVLDANGDGRNDVALAVAVGVEVLLQDESGLLQPGVLLPGTEGARYLAAGDMDGDGDTDLVYSAQGVFLLTQGAGGTFAKSTVATGTTWHEVEIGDLDGDGRNDVASPAVNGVAVHLAGAGGWTTTFYGHNVSDGGTPRGIEVADLNGDGRADIAATLRSNQGQLAVFRQLSGGTMVRSSIEYLYYEPDGIEAGDWDGDGRLDLFVAHGGFGALSTFRQHAEGYLEPARGAHVSLPVYPHANGFAAGDLDGDGRADLATAAEAHKGIWFGYSAYGARPGRGPQVWVKDTSVPARGRLGRGELVLTMQRELDPASVNGGTVRLVRGSTGAVLALPVSYDPATRTITIRLVTEAQRPGPGRPPARAVLPDNLSYRLVLDGVEDSTGSVLSGYSVWYVG
ncbi:hypothetical protein CS0771_12050 [Catellatospora sp. IY07-71]|uniref:S8 family serine peptidase n=1 Tax=Catellatospora sp. IY07-71 TaxID=2728827 RepID=UPI001BB42A8A|nr:S8 family serine peptidase [Catellatospora sp. IY07-71]BCJ71661.1 hypothetical protein CS0771_12050 [Catellatospora sp. IY07-71]